MIPANITKAHLEQAIAEIDRDGIRKGRHSSTYDLLHEGQAYPPKLVISIANRYANGEELDPGEFGGGEGTKAFELLRQAGFRIIPKGDPVRQMVDNYKLWIAKTKLQKEVYKWQLIERFRGRPNIHATDFGQEIMELDFSNLIYYNAHRVLQHLARDRPEELRQQFIGLFTEEKDLGDRVEAFSKGILEIYRSLGETDPHHQDERSMATYLTYQYPEKHTFYKASVYTKFCELLGVKKAKKNKKYLHHLGLLHSFIADYIIPDQELIEQVQALIPEYYDGTSHLLLAQDILFQMLEKSDKPTAETTKPSENRGYWVYAPGENASRWEEFYELGIMGLGWDELGDLNNLGDKKDIVRALQTAYNTKSKSYNNALANLEFRDAVQIGDIIIPKKGRRDYLGYGVVTSDYYYDPDRQRYHHCRKVDWKKKGTWHDNEGDIVLKTLTDITKYPGYVERLIKLLGIEENTAVSQTLNTMPQYALNTIFYGPPGTGKTYQTKALALDILDNEAPTDRVAINQRYQELAKAGRVQFVTFHQSTTYEDFVEGIKPILTSEEDEVELAYQIEDGIFKRLCVLAAYEYIRHQNQEQAAVKTLTFNQRYDQLLNDFQQRLDDGEDVIIPLKSDRDIQVIEISKRGNFILQHQDGQRTYTVSRARSEKLDSEIENFNNIPNIYAYFRDIIGGSNASAYWAILNQLYQIKGEAAVVPAPDKVVNYATKQQAYDRINWEEVDATAEVPKYLLIIDEINRGNVAAIFGELITLLEEDKRGGAAEYLKATLPYSKQGLVVPSNLYLIGTMNTADRSVEALDTALRRRFSFTEVGPQPQLLADVAIDGLDLPNLLTTINRRIELLLDKDHCIGHAYFMGVGAADDPWQALREVFAQKVLPLLEEYFFGAPGKIQLVLGKAFCPKQESDYRGSNPFASDAEYGEGEYDTREVYRTPNLMEMSMEEFQAAIRAITA